MSIDAMRRATVLLTDRAWPDDQIEREVIEGGMVWSAARLPLSPAAEVEQMGDRSWARGDHDVLGPEYLLPPLVPRPRCPVRACKP